MRPARLFRRLAAVAAVLAVGAGGALGAVAPAAAAEDAPVSWSVSPADANGPDDRYSVEHEIDPGRSVDDFFAVRNLGAETVTFALSAADGFYNDNGRFDMLPSDRESVDAGTWIDLPESVTVAAGETAVVPFTLTVPDNAEPGDHAAGIAASVLSTTSGDGASVGLESRVGFRVMTRVTGELAPAFSVRQVAADYRTSWNPLRPGDLTVSFEVVNEGNTRLSTAGFVAIAGREAVFPSETDRTQDVLPGERHVFTVEFDRIWPLFLFTGEITVAPSTSTADGGTTEVATSSTSLVVWAMPWPQLLVLAGLVLLVVALVWRRGRSKRRVEALLAAAREEGRRERVDSGAAVSADRGGSAVAPNP